MLQNLSSRERRAMRTLYRYFQKNPPPPPSDPMPIGLMANVPDLDADDNLVRHVRRFAEKYLDGQAFKPSQLLRPGPSFDWDRSDAALKYANHFGAKYHAHTPLWPADLVDLIDFGYPATDKVARTAFHRWLVEAIFDRYTGLLYSCDLWNEVIANDGGSPGDEYKQFPGAPSLDDDEIADAFAAAYAKDPNCKLGLNDFGCEVQGDKLDSYLRVARRLLDAGVQLRILGLQCHENIDEFHSKEDYAAAFAQIASECPEVEVHLTEVDCVIGSTRAGARIPGTLAQRLHLQEELLENLGSAAAEAPNVTEVTFWGPTSNLSWRNGYNGVSYPDEQPLPFDHRFEPTPSWDAFRDPILIGQ